MIIKRFRAESFRNIEKCDIEFSPGVNLLHGKNAQGKTNAMEGIYLFSRGRSFRGKDDSELMMMGSDGFRIAIEYEDKSGEQSLEYAHIGKDRLRKKNGYKISKVAEMIGSFRAVLFYPDNLSLVKDGPEERRAFLNIACANIYPSYIKIYADYKKALENRNCLLKFANKGYYFDERELASWSESMAEYASHIYIARAEYTEMLERHAREILLEISDGKEELALSYKSDIEKRETDRLRVREEYRRLLSENISREIGAGITLYGPHKDDIDIRLSGISARSFASQGQQRSVVLAMKLGEGEVCREISGEYPVFLFDDVLSELDEQRRRYVLTSSRERQIIITSCESEEYSRFADREIDVSDGKYKIIY